MTTPKYAIFNDDWSLNRYETGTNFSATTGRNFTDATKHSVDTLLEHYVKPVTQTPKPSSEWQDVASQPDVLIEGEGAAQSATLTWPTAPISLDAAKAKLRAKVKQCKFARMDAGIEFAVGETTYLVQTDADSRSLIDSTFALAVNGYLPDGRGWRMGDNSYPTLTQQQLIDMALAVGAMVGDCYDAQSELETAIDALMDIEACMAFDCSSAFPAAPDPVAL
ncbi:DUF4376 domain-containing protein [Thalassospira sp.]|uniref:DUF4376 domain-containing protein n=1 Tax=Thalassospira sp. TaxID=1912094 RepID=UPI001B185ED5|nr:DUF4376 domain-containing protein [Thalassospira sp.]MBO6808426.1 DUF4376 domain-containing protein [Thalassospira sp.]MBO6839876.1 DUF4376 domain-containing protein [Thalassospira sp.]